MIYYSQAYNRLRRNLMAMSVAKKADMARQKKLNNRKKY